MRDTKQHSSPMTLTLGLLSLGLLSTGCGAMGLFRGSETENVPEVAVDPKMEILVAAFRETRLQEDSATEQIKVLIEQYQKNLIDDFIDDPVIRDLGKHSPEEVIRARLEELVLKDLPKRIEAVLSNLE
jgi:hypothetical protein